MAGEPTLRQMERHGGLLEKREMCLCLKGKSYCTRLVSGDGCGQCHNPVVNLGMCDLPNNSG